LGGRKRPISKEISQKGGKGNPGDAAPTLTKDTLRKAATKKKAAKKATGKAKKSAE
jgi:DNA topoisomerase-1